MDQPEPEDEDDSDADENPFGDDEEMKDDGKWWPILRLKWAFKATDLQMNQNWLVQY